jgi:N-acetylneuraminic acid mutarotase
VGNPAPRITSLSPASVPAGSAAQSITISGNYFLGSSTATYNGASRPVSYVNATQITIALATGDLQTAGSYQIVVTNPAPDGGFSNSYAFTVTGAALVSGVWTWINGSDLGEQSGVYGALGAPSAGNHPGSRYGSTTWKDSHGNLWLFGGGAIDTSGKSGVLNDLWKYDPLTNQWTWIAGSNTVNQPGVYGALGISADGNVPGSRMGSLGWTDSSGNLWLFGGSGYYTSGKGGELNDLWIYNPATNQWTWVSGANTSDQFGVYGTLGTPSAANMPGSRTMAGSWTDSNGNFWLFGGGGYGASGSEDDLNDLWMFSPSTKQWTWVGGSQTKDQPGVYGTLGTAASANHPGNRDLAMSWTDSSGNLWLFGGEGYDTAGSFRLLNDLWKYNSTTNQWAWMSGCDTGNQFGVYGTLGTPAAGSHPGGTIGGTTWTDSSGNLWLFGGLGYQSSYEGEGVLNDLWKFNPSTNQWAWMGGGSASNQAGVYGTLGTPSDDNLPGGRFLAASWRDDNGDFWLFGGAGVNATGQPADLNDLWLYHPTTPKDSPVKSVTVTCAPASITTAQTSQCVASVAGTGNQSPTVAWSATNGFITSAGVFTPPPGAGSATIMAVSTQDPSKSAGTSVTIIYAIPTITSLSPNSLVSGSPGQWITINGTNFAYGSTVTFNGASRSVQYISANEISVQLITSDLTTAGSYPVVVINPAPGGGASNTATFVVTAKP